MGVHVLLKVLQWEAEGWVVQGWTTGVREEVIRRFTQRSG